MRHVLHPAKESFEAVYQKQKNQLVWLTLPSDTVTPVAALQSLAKLSPHHMLLESVEGGESRGRYSLIALMPDVIWTWNNGQATLESLLPEYIPASIPLSGNPFESLRALLNQSRLEIPSPLPSIACGLYGYMNYDMVRYMERVPHTKKDTIGIPESMYMRPRVTLLFDSIKDEVHLIAPVWFDARVKSQIAYTRARDVIEEVIRMLRLPAPRMPYTPSESEAPAAATVQSHIDLAGYTAMVNKAKEYIQAGDIFQVVPSRRSERPFDLPPLSLYRSLRSLNPSPYLFYLQYSGFTLLGASPEILVRVEQNKVTIRPIAGTRKRGATREEDLQLEQELLADPKECAEHLMLLDLGRNDVGRVSEGNSVRVTERMVIERYSHVMHIVSNVEGTLRKECDAIDALIAGFPAGTVSGAPKIRAMEIIDELEPESRSFYAGTVGYFSSNGNMDTCIALRTGLVKDKTLYVQAGGGVVADSDPVAEFEETNSKARALLRAAELAWRYTEK